MDNFYLCLIKEAKFEKIKNSVDLERFKEKTCKKFRVDMPTNADIRGAYEVLLKENKIERDAKLESLLKSKNIRTLSGVAVVAVLTKPEKCFGDCLYCPSEKNMPKSYLSNEPAVMRAISSSFDPYYQVQKRLEALFLNGHDISKIEIIVMGGTFSHLSKDYRTWFIKECFRGCNKYKLQVKSEKLKVEDDKSYLFSNEKTARELFRELEREQKKNEVAGCRVVGLTLETRPDCIDEEEVQEFLELGATRVELGVQSVFDSVLKVNRRGHGVKEIVKATRLLKNAGFKISYHLMPGLLGSNLKKDLKTFEKVFFDSRFKPDLIKIYPCVVTENSDLYELYNKNKYAPLSDEETKELILKIKKIVPEYVRVSRIIRDIPTSSIVAGPKISNLRQLIEKESICRCIRCRESKNEYSKDEPSILRRKEYKASGGKEIFLEICSSDEKKLFSLLRLRIFKEKGETKAFIREVHTYGKVAGISKDRNGRKPQHSGMGKKLVQEAEKIAFEEFGAKKISVISGVGVREYYRKLGYRLEKTYMVKEF